MRNRTRTANRTCIRHTHLFTHTYAFSARLRRAHSGTSSRMMKRTSKAQATAAARRARAQIDDTNIVGLRAAEEVHQHPRTASVTVTPTNVTSTTDTTTRRRQQQHTVGEQVDFKTSGASRSSSLEHPATIQQRVRGDEHTRGCAHDRTNAEAPLRRCRSSTCKCSSATYSV